MSWIAPLEMNTWLVNVFAGNQDIFIAIALMSIISLSAFFRMNGILTFFMVGTFLLMFSDIIQSPILALIGIFGGLIIGFWISKIVK